MEKERLCTVEEIAGVLKVPMKTIYYWVSRGEIPCIRVGRHLRFLREEVIQHFRCETNSACRGSLGTVEEKGNCSLTTWEANSAYFRKE